MNAIQKAAKFLEELAKVGFNGYHINGCKELADELEALLKQEPVGYQFRANDGEWCNFVNQKHYDATLEDGRWPIRAIYTDPRPPCDLRALVEDVRNEVRLASFIEKGRYQSCVGFRTVDLNAIIAKHTK